MYSIYNFSGVIAPNIYEFKVKNPKINRKLNICELDNSFVNQCWS